MRPFVKLPDGVVRNILPIRDKTRKARKLPKWQDPEQAAEMAERAERDAELDFFQDRDNQG